MKVEFLNQYKQKWEVDGNKSEEVFRTKKTLDKLIESLELKGHVTDGEWVYEGVVVCVYGITADSEGDIVKVQEFNRKKHKVDFGNKGYHTLGEILEADLIWVKGYGVVYDKNGFKEKFEEVAQKK